MITKIGIKYNTPYSTSNKQNISFERRWSSRNIGRFADVTFGSPIALGLSAWIFGAIANLAVPAAISKLGKSVDVSSVSYGAISTIIVALCAASVVGCVYKTGKRIFRRHNY